MTKLKAFADNKINVAQIMISVSGRVENIVGKRRKCWLTAFSTFPIMFSSFFFFFFFGGGGGKRGKALKVGICGKKLTTVKVQALENIFGKDKNSGYQHFLLFHTFYHYKDRYNQFSNCEFCCLQMLRGCKNTKTFSNWLTNSFFKGYPNTIR